MRKKVKLAPCNQLFTDCHYPKAQDTLLKERKKRKKTRIAVRINAHKTVSEALSNSY